MKVIKNTKNTDFVLFVFYLIVRIADAWYSKKNNNMKFAHIDSDSF